ncbi:MAG TPA: hypothetical protein VFN35_12960 [Ktedonobacteraceae bacterium]|nr:hypothetical protein [Ktedonobacteraceae bacterium]
MQKTDTSLLSVTGRFLDRLGPVTSLLDSISERLLPRTVGQAAGGGCYTYCSAYCNHYGDRQMFSVEANTEEECTTGPTHTVYLGCIC